MCDSLTPEHPAREVPDASWPLDRLGHFCGRIIRRQAADAWLLGRAFSVARGKIKHGGWMAWVKVNCPGIGPKTVNRYKLLAERLSLAEVRGVGLTECYQRAGMITTTTTTAVTRRRPAPDRPARGKRARPTAPRLPSWAVPDPYADGMSDPVTEADVWDDDETPTDAERLREEWEDRLPHLLRQLEESLTFVMDAWEGHGPGVPSDLHDQAVASVGDKLKMLAAMTARTASALPHDRPRGEPPALAA